jgi:nucleotide-binding universal stress UspA family protein
MSLKLVVGVDGSGGDRALAHAKRLARMVEGAELILVYVIEWSPFTFQTPEENEERHKRREEEISTAHSRVLDPAVSSTRVDGFEVRGIVRHGKVADLLNAVALEENADGIIVARATADGIAARIFGTSTAALVMSASVPVTVVA